MSGLILGGAAYTAVELAVHNAGHDVLYVSYAHDEGCEDIREAIELLPPELCPTRKDVRRWHFENGSKLILATRDSIDVMRGLRFHAIITSIGAVLNAEQVSLLRSRIFERKAPAVDSFAKRMQALRRGAA